MEMAPNCCILVAARRQRTARMRSGVRDREQYTMIETIAPASAISEQARDGIWSHRNRPLTIGLTMTVVAAAFEALAVATTLPATTRDIGGLALYGWAFSAFMLANL